MKIKLLFFLFPLFISAQKYQFIELRKSIKDKNHHAKSLTLLDRREDKFIGIVSHRKDPYEVKFEKEDLEKLFSDWFIEYNKERGNNQYFCMLEYLKVEDVPTERSVKGHLDMRASTFLKKNNQYYFLKKNRISKDYHQKDHAYITRAIAANISSELSSIIKDSYDIKEFNIPLSEMEIENYEKVISEQLPIFRSAPFTDGVYRDYKSFAEQNPDKELVVKKNKDGVIKGVKRVDDYDNLNKEVFAVVDNGIAYKKIPTSIIEIEKDNNGFFIMVSEEELFPQNNAMTITGAAAFGLIGGLIGAVIDAASSKARKQNAKYYRVGIDALTGEYILPENFGRLK
ncbi:hypothetical protein SAMN05421786_10397 [Chryseobacterium ureilyticum]|uniref:Uncharacterized protein n=1 Tax=Chryseobacterium ureilyticum TaxID=373668 RepID=A0A1N7N0F1_9FLAO|nr:hypothetical protein [Chryseobacterium ureilyticum]SIS91864.1 hypothetical protein SAMN05421786_10397 [Chryseobacterium ureilyticum]